jgi:polysaccharide pyruvyl transferase WcaK-like protein
MIIPLINDTEGRENIGCNLTSKTLKKKIKEEFIKFKINVEIQSCPYLFNNKSEEIKVWWNNQLKNRSLKDFIIDNNFYSNLYSLALLEYGKESIDNCVNHDVIFFQPEGTLSIKFSLERIIGFFSLPLYLKSIGKKIVMINGSIPLYYDDRKDLIEKIIDNFDFKYARDQITSNFYKINFIPDSAFVFYHQKTNSTKSGILITTGAENKKFEDEAILNLALTNCDKYNLRPIIITKNTKSFIDYKDIILEKGGIFLESESLETVAKLIDSCVLHIGGRYHMAIFCLIRSVPSLLYDIPSHKNKWLAENFETIELFNFNSDVSEKIDYLIKLSSNTDDVKYQESINNFLTTLSLLIKNLIKDNYDTNFYRI